MNKRGQKFIEQKFQIKPVHKSALFFHPKFKALRPFANDEKSLIHTHANELINLLPAQPTVALESMDHNYSSKSTSASSAAGHLDTGRISNQSIDDKFSEWHSPLPVVSERNEVEKYVQSMLNEDTLSSCHTNGKFDILKYWVSANKKKSFRGCIDLLWEYFPFQLLAAPVSEPLVFLEMLSQKSEHNLVLEQLILLL